MEISTPKYEILTDPWPHIIIDDFLADHHLNSLLSLSYDENPKLESPSVSSYQIINKEYKKKFPKKWEKLGKKNVIKKPNGTNIPKSLVLGISKGYKNLLLEILKELNPRRIPLYDYTEVQIASTHKDTVYRMHTDSPDRLLTCVVYLKPESNTGTVMSVSENGPDIKTVEWKRNRAFIFSSIKDLNPVPKPGLIQTWHRWQGDNLNSRHVLIIILRSDKSRLSKNPKSFD